MNKKLLFWAVVLLTVVNVAALATFSYHRLCYFREQPHERKHHRRHFLHRELDLTDAQAKEMRALKKAFHTSVRPIRVELRAKRTALAQLLMAPQPDRTKIDAVQSGIDSMQAEIQKLVIDHLLAEKLSLTPEQQVKFFRIIRQKLMKPPPHHE